MGPILGKEEEEEEDTRNYIIIIRPIIIHPFPLNLNDVNIQMTEDLNQVTF
jgi:hypothetical protein